MTTHCRHLRLTLCAAVAVYAAGCPREDTGEVAPGRREPPPDPITMPLLPKIVFEKRSSPPAHGGRIGGRVTHLPAGRWILQWRDAAGVLDELPLAGPGERAFSFEISWPRMRRNRIVLVKRGRRGEEASGAFHVALSPPGRDGYLGVLVPGGTPVTREHAWAAVQWRAGHEEVPAKNDDRPLLIDLGLDRLGSPPPFEQWRVKAVSSSSPSPAGRVRRPCLSDPAHRESARAHIRKALAHGASRSAAAISLGTGLSPTRRGVPYDFCRSEHCTRAFRLFVKKRRGTLARVRAAWGLPVESWEEVTPRGLEECGFPRADGYAAWGDAQAFRDEVFDSFVREMVQEVRRACPGVPVGYFGAAPAGAYAVPDLDRATAHVDWRGVSAGPASDLWRTFALRGGGRLRIAAHRTAEDGSPLTSALTGELIQLFGPEKGHGAAEASLLARGLGRLVELSDPPGPRRGEGPAARVALVYSPGSVRASFLVDAASQDLPWKPAPTGAARVLEEEDSSFRRVWTSWMLLLDDLGVPFSVVTSDEVARGDLSSRGYRLAILARTLSTAPRHAAALEEFARAGGIVVADGGAGCRDESFPTARPRPLEKLFGIERARCVFSERGARRMKIADRLLKFTSPPGEPSWFPRTHPPGLGPAESGLSLTTGRAEGAFGGVPCLVVNRVGGGWAVMLNLAVSAYPELRARGAGGPLRELVTGTLRRARIAPLIQVRVEGEERAHVVARMRRFGAATLLVVWREPSGTTQAGKVRVRVRPRGVTGTAYDPVHGTCLGWTRELDLELAPGEARVFTFLPYRLQAVIADQLGRPAGDARQGPERIEMLLRKEGDRSYCIHVVELELIGPDGAPRRELRQLVEISAGRAETVIPFAASDPGGQWTLRLRDAATGMVSVARLTRWTPGRGR